MEQPTATLILKQGRDKPVRNRHPWVFSGAIGRVEGQPAPGDLVTVADHKGQPLATAYYNAKSQIQARILSWEPQRPIDEGFWRERLLRSIEIRDRRYQIRGESDERRVTSDERRVTSDELRMTSDESPPLPIPSAPHPPFSPTPLPPRTTAYRLINAEADGLPGLVVDRYGDYLVMQCLTLGIDRRKEMLTGLLAEPLRPVGILERSDVDVRGKEGLKPVIETRTGETPPAEVTIRENGFQFLVDLHRGHKTGFYLDQRDNREVVGRPAIMAGRDVLNVFAYTGAFGVYAAAAGALQIVQVDSSAPALETAERNMQLNGLDKETDEYIAGDAFEVLRYFREEGRQFDAVILDPPKFAHNQGQIDRAARGYKDLNWLALRLLRPNGILATFSCSGLISAELFQKIVFGAAVDAGRDVQIMRPLGQSADHPVLLSFPESAYLKGLLCRVL